MSNLEVGISQKIITPQPGVELLGYFNPRPNNGVLDDIYVKVILFRQQDFISGIVSFDLCFASLAVNQEIIRRLNAAGCAFAGNLLFTATHCHTSPHTEKYYHVSERREYVDFLVQTTVEAIAEAEKKFFTAELRHGFTVENPFAFNRRYWMANGKVVTNPGFGNPEIVEAESLVDDRISVMAIYSGNRVTAIIANIVNHTDTVGGNLVSADWPGRMTAELRRQFGDIAVVALIGCSGNVNHFDVYGPGGQTNYAEATRIGTGYGRIIGKTMPFLKKVEDVQIKLVKSIINIPYRKVTHEQLTAAEAVVEKFKDADHSHDMTSEGLASEENPVCRFFAEQVIMYNETCAGKSRDFELLSIKFNSRLAMTSLPGEPFTEIGLAIKALSPFKHTWVVALSMGNCGYVPMPYSFERGGYETMLIENGTPELNTAQCLIEYSSNNLLKIALLNHRGAETQRKPFLLF